MLSGQYIVPTANADRTISYQFTQTGTYEILGAAMGGGSSISITCTAAPALPEEVVEDLAEKSTRNDPPVVRQTIGLVGDRIRTALPRGNFKGLNRNRPVGLAAFSTDGATDDPREGAAGGEEDVNIAAWANFAWTAANSDDPAFRSDTDSFTTIAGIDTFLTPDLLAGAAVSVSYSHLETPLKTVDSQEIGFMIAPYAAWALDDIFSIDASLGYGLFFTENHFFNESLKGNTKSHRYFLSTSASGLTYWDRFGLQGDVGLFWSQAFQDGYSLSDSTQIAERDSSLGTVFTHVRPSYIVYAEEDSSIEPFAAFSYEYDYTRTKVRAGSNDRDKFKLGGGVSLFGDGLSGELAAETELGRKNEDATTVSGTVRVDF